MHACLRIWDPNTYDIDGNPEDFKTIMTKKIDDDQTNGKEEKEEAAGQAGCLPDTSGETKKTEWVSKYNLWST